MARHALSWLLVAGGCDDSGRLVVDVRTDLVAGEELDELTVSLVAEGEERVQRRVVLAGDRPLEGLRVADSRGLRGETELRVTAALERAEVVARPVRVDVRGRVGVTVSLPRDCRGVECPLPEGDPRLTACVGGGMCGDPACTEDSPEACPTACAVDTDCAASADCTTAICSAGTCVQALTEGACAAGRLCDPDIGCVDRAPVPDGGLLDGAPGDGAPADGAGPDAGSPDAGTCVEEIEICDGFDQDWDGVIDDRRVPRADTARHRVRADGFAPGAPTGAPALFADDVGWVLAWTSTASDVVVLLVDEDMGLTRGPASTVTSTGQALAPALAWTGAQLGVAWLDGGPVRRPLSGARRRNAGAARRSRRLLGGARRPRHARLGRLVVRGDGMRDMAFRTVSADGVAGPVRALTSANDAHDPVLAWIGARSGAAWEHPSSGQVITSAWPRRRVPRRPVPAHRRRRRAHREPGHRHHHRCRHRDRRPAARLARGSLRDRVRRGGAVGSLVRRSSLAWRRPARSARAARMATPRAAGVGGRRRARVRDHSADRSAGPIRGSTGRRRGWGS